MLRADSESAYPCLTQAGLSASTCEPRCGAPNPCPQRARITLTGRDFRLLERVRQRIAAAPGARYRLGELASLACMSQSTLRAKFHAAYDCSVFTWLRECRLAQARERLARGWTVQQAAHAAGYSHATNFATAFRRRYGVPPSHCS